VKDTLATFPEHAGAIGIHMVADPTGQVWGAFESGGLLRVDPETDEPHLLLENESVQNVRAVGDSLVLASTQGGVYLVGSRSGTIRRHLTQADGLLSNTAGGAFLTADTLYVSHPSGLTLLPADRISQGFSSPPSLLTEMEVNLNDRTLTGDSVLAAAERTVGFSYTAPELTHPERLRYEIRLRPRDREWYTTGRDFTRYTDLGPGTYQFAVRARLGNAPPGPTATYSFTIPPLFYETWWFRLLVGLGLIGLGVGAWRWRTYQLRRRQETLEAAVETQTQELRERTEELAAEKQKTEKQAELDEAKNRFFAHVSHEFRTPLSLLRTPLEEALRDATANTVSFGREQVERMVRSARRLHRLIEQLLDLATLEAGRMTLDRKPGDLARFVRRAAEAFASMAEQKNVDLRVRTDNASMKSRFDPDKVESIVNNLLSNALKFTPEGGRVTVWIGRSKAPLSASDGAPGTAIIKVADTGPGMDAETQARVFERFEQAEGTTEEHEGAGLGLALTKELVELHDGTIHVESTPGEGTVFTVALPLADREDALVEDSASAPDTASIPVLENGTGGFEAVGDGRRSGEAATVLVVEDNDEMRTYLRDELGDYWHIREAADGEEGWEAVQEQAPDLVLSGVMMPGLGGFELCERIKSDTDLRNVPVLLLTARAKTEDTVEGLDCGADDYVPKPFDVEELRQRIKNHLAARRHLRDQYRREVRVEPLDTVVDEQHVSFLETVTEAVETHLGDPEFSVDRLAEAAALSRRQLTRRMKEAVGQTPAAFIRARRMERAKEMLAGGAETVSEVAYAVGFRSPSAFSKRFREHVGHAPSEYAEQQAE
jgi:signal transduction histidine kinase/DNA-binding response OmpR family regulator